MNKKLLNFLNLFSIYDDIGDYVPEKKTGDTTKSKSDDTTVKKGYFDFKKKDEKEETMVRIFWMFV